MSEKKLASRNAVITLGIICVILAVGLVGSVANLEYQIQTLKIQTKSDISSFQNQISLLNSKISVLTDPETGNAINYISNFMFVPSVGLDKEAPVAAPNTLWLTNDNLEVYAVLSKLGNSRATTIKQSLDKYGVNGNGLVELLLDRTIAPIKTPNYYTVDTIGQYTIMKEVRNGNLMQDFYNYTDLCFWWSKNLLLSNNVSGALWYFNKGMSYWNGTGFLDRPFNESVKQGYPQFATFKVGLALWMAEQLNQTVGVQIRLADFSKMEGIIWKMQDPTRAKYSDLALESRCLTTIGRQNINPIPLFRMERFQKESQELRKRE